MSEYRMETLDADGLVLRAPPEGRITLRLGWGLAWIPDRRPDEVRLRVIRESNGELMASAELTDNAWELDNP